MEVGVHLPQPTRGRCGITKGGPIRFNTILPPIILVFWTIEQGLEQTIYVVVGERTRNTINRGDSVQLGYCTADAPKSQSTRPR